MAKKTNGAKPIRVVAQNSDKSAGIKRKPTPQSLANIEPHRFKPGQSGNPGGRPKTKPMTEAYQKLLNEVVPTHLVPKGLARCKGLTYGEMIALGQARMAISGFTAAAKEIADRIEGKSVARIEVDGDIEGVGGYNLEETLRKIDEVYGIVSTQGRKAGK